MALMRRSQLAAARNAGISGAEILANTVALHEATIAEQADTIADRDQTISDQTDTIAARDATISDQTTQITDMGTAMEGAIIAIDAAIAAVAAVNSAPNLAAAQVAVAGLDVTLGDAGGDLNANLP